MAAGHLPGGPYLPNGRPNVARSNPKDPDQLAEPNRTRVKAMIADCPWRGELGLVSGLRDPGSQWELRRDRVGLANIWNPAVQGAITTAVPARWNAATGRWEGGSRHQVGTAADFGGTARAMDWMRANRERYGLALTVPKEGWHVEPDRRDIHTGRVHNNPTALAGRPTQPTPKPPTPKGPLDMLTDAEQTELLAKIRQIDSRTSGIEKAIKATRAWVRVVAEMVAGQVGRTPKQIADRAAELNK